MRLDEAKDLAEKLMGEHGVTAKGYLFEFDDAVRRFGCCNYRLKRITLSAVLVELNDESHVRQTILHEIAHALAPRAGHNAEWKQVAMSIGHHGGRCYSADVLQPSKPFVGTCPKCGKTVQAHKRTKIACWACCKAFNGGRFDRQFKFQWVRVTA